MLDMEIINIDKLIETLLEEELELREELYYSMCVYSDVFQYKQIIKQVKDGKLQTVEQIKTLVDELLYDYGFLNIHNAQNTWFIQCYHDYNEQYLVEIGEFISSSKSILQKYKNNGDYFFDRLSTKAILVDWCTRFQKPKTDRDIELWG